MSIYKANKALFEQCLDRMLADAAAGRAKEAGERRATLLEAYNGNLDCLERQHLQRIEEANLRLPTPIIINDNDRPWG